MLKLLKKLFAWPKSRRTAAIQARLRKEAAQQVQEYGTMPWDD